MQSKQKDGKFFPKTAALQVFLRLLGAAFALMLRAKGLKTRRLCLAMPLQSLRPVEVMPFVPAKIVYPGSFDPTNFGHINMLTKAALGHPDNTVRVVVQVRPKKKSVPRILELDNAAALFSMAVPQYLAGKVEVTTSPSIRSFFRAVGRETTHLVRGVRYQQHQLGRELVVASALSLARAATHGRFAVVLLKQDSRFDAVSSRNIRRALLTGGKALESIRLAVPDPVSELLVAARRRVHLTPERQSISDYNAALREGVGNPANWGAVTPTTRCGPMPGLR